jgi:transcription antitermination factor NusG
MKTYDDLKAELPIKKGDRVKIKKGAFIRTTRI